MILEEYYQTKCRETGYNDKMKQCIENAKMNIRGVLWIIESAWEKIKKQ